MLIAPGSALPGASPMTDQVKRAVREHWGRLGDLQRILLNESANHSLTGDDCVATGFALGRFAVATGARFGFRVLGAGSSRLVVAIDSVDDTQCDKLAAKVVWNPLGLGHNLIEAAKYLSIDRAVRCHLCPTVAYGGDGISLVRRVRPLAPSPQHEAERVLAKRHALGGEARLPPPLYEKQDDAFAVHRAGMEAIAQRPMSDAARRPDNSANGG